MKEFDYNINPDAKLSGEVERKIKKVLDEKIEFKEFTKMEAIIFSKPYFYFSIISIIIIGWLLMLFRKTQWTNYCQKDTKNIRPTEIYKTAFESLYSNIKIEKPSNVNWMYLSVNRGIGVPEDATIDSSHVGQTFILNNMPLGSAWINWRWVRSNGKSTQVYYKQKIYIFSYTINPSFKDFVLHFKKSKLNSRKGKSLENDKFNKEFWYSYNDEVKCRMFFPLSAQERWVEVHQNNGEIFNKVNSFEMKIKNNQYILSRNPVYKLEYGMFLSKKVVSNKEEFIDSIFQNILNNIKEISTSMRLMTINRYFFND